MEDMFSARGSAEQGLSVMNTLYRMGMAQYMSKIFEFLPLPLG